MRGLIGMVVWTPVVGTVVGSAGLASAGIGWLIQDFLLRYVGGALASVGGVIGLTWPVATAVMVALLVWTRPVRWKASAAVALVPLLGPVGVWHWTLSPLWAPAPVEKRQKRRKEELVTAPPGWLTAAVDTGPTPLPWNPEEADTICERLPAVRQLWEWEPDFVATTLVKRPRPTLRTEGSGVKSEALRAPGR